ncbi:MAG: glycerophosphodiester phosphodiesterase [Pseudonocardiales bacterium]|nr:glycerophosphodiester phosphodiesterase [Pseudonocardiales bacterium]
MTRPNRGSNLINLESVSKSYGTTSVLDGVSLGIAARERIGVVGRNGGGKSTLLRMITELDPPDAGRVARATGVEIAMVDQRDALTTGATIREVVVGTGAEHEWASDSAVREVLSGLGLGALGLDTDVTRLSGGERRRVALATALVKQADLLVLDEPTNHLDVEGIAWLAAYLVGLRRALIVVTHDRWFLDAVCERTWEVIDGQVVQFDGGYAAYVLARAERARQAGASETRRQNLLRKELAWLRRGAPARTSKPKFRIDAANALIDDEPELRQPLELKALAQKRLGRTVFELKDVTVNAGERVLMEHLDWNVGPGDRIGVIGVNGSGKTHLLRVLIGQQAAAAGKVTIGQTVQVAYLSQELTELPGNLRVIEAVKEIRSSAELGGVDMSAGQLAERFGFESQRQWTPVKDLSGGERRRLQILRLLLTQPNVLVLDEPTNDLDTDTLAELESLLDSWAGTLVVVSHDRYLIERVCDSTVAIRDDGTLAALPGGIDQYLAERASARAAARPVPTAKAAVEHAPAAAAATQDVRAARKELTRLEREIARLDKREAQIHVEMAAKATDYAAVATLDAELRELLSAKEAAEHAWLELAE